jgi:hypothetical protein
MTFETRSMQSHVPADPASHLNFEMLPPPRARLPIPKAELLSQLAALERKLRARIEPSPLEKLIPLQHLNRVWRRYLTPLELSVAFYVLDRSTGWGNSMFMATSANVLHGTQDYSGVGLPERTYFKTLKELERKGFLFRKSRRDKTVLGLHLDWQPWN